MPVLALALLSMACAAANDFVFKLYARRSGPVGAYLAVIGVIWALAFAACLPSRQVLLQPATLLWGAVSGVFSITANILYVMALKKEDVGVCSTIYRLNLVPAAFLAFLLFGEPATAPRLAAIAAGVAAVLFFSWPSGRAAAKPFVSFSIAAVFLASLLRAGMGLSYKAGLLAGADEFGLMTINGCAWIAGGAGFHFMANRAAWRAPRSTFAYGAVSGALVCGIVLFLVLALKRGDASLVLPVTQMSFALTVLAGIAFMHEPLTLRKCAGVSLGAACILLMGIR
ncbi:MAG: EamA family transporter [Kiritimatiellia bacterium]